MSLCCPDLDNGYFEGMDV
jgi:hypothetical protein